MKSCYNCRNEIREDFNFCPHCGSNQNEIVCPNCSYSNEPNSKFCQECGTQLNGKQKKEKRASDELIDQPVPETGITVEFKYSTSQTFDFAIEEAKKFSSYQQIGEDKKAIYRVNVPEDEIESLEPLLENLKGWRNRKVYHNGEKVLWDSLFSYQWCYDQRKASYKPDLYCFGYENDYEYNLWGCIQTRLSFNDHSELFTYGKWLNTNGDWTFDKDRISHVLEKKLYPYRFCPAMNLELVKDVLLAFPEKVNPTKDKDWKFVKNYHSQDGLKITEKSSFGYIDEYYANGAAPVSMNKFLEQIAKRMTRKLPSGII
jgi:RNA polymerase subunit RPABC4/transcription elongation factor Spt4